MKNASAKILEGNWDQLKGKVKKHWGELSDHDIDVIQGSYDQLIGKLKAVYGYSVKEAESQVDKYLTSLEDNGSEILATIADSLETCKEKIGELEGNTVTFVKKNPMKSIGIAVLAGFVVGKICNLIK